MIEEIETEMTYGASELQTTTSSCMQCMQLSPKTQNGRDTLHDTVGITYEVLTSSEKDTVSESVSRKCPQPILAIVKST